METAARVEQRVKPRLFYGWYIVGVGFLSNVASSFALASTLAIFLKPLTADLDVSRGVFSLLRSGEGIIGACLAPLVGTLVDRHGGARLMAVGATLVGVGYLFLGHVDTFAQFVLIRLALVTFGDALMGSSVVGIVISRWFVRQRGRALAVSSMGIGFAKVCMPVVGAWLILVSGWRHTWTIFGFGAMVLGVAPALLFVRRSPEDMGLHPDGDFAPASTQEKSAARPKFVPLKISADADVRWSPREALRTSAFWLLALTFGIASIGVTGLNLHIYSYVTDLGYSAVVAASVMSVIASMQLASPLAWGFLTERIDARYAAMLRFIVQALGLALAVMMVISLWKDVPYSCAMLALFLIVLRAVRTEGTWLKTGLGMAALCSAVLLTSLYRHNGLPVTALFLIVMLILWRNVCFKQLLRVSFDWIVAFVIITGPIYRIIGVAPMAKFFVLQNIMHQIGALTQHGAIESESDRSFLASIQPMEDWVKYYDCYSLNVLIYNEHVQHQFVEFHALQVLDVWQRWARKNPAILLEHQRCVTSMLWQIREPREKAGRLYTTELGIVENDLSLRSASLWPRLRYGLEGIVQMTLNPSIIWFIWRPAFYLYFLLLLVALAAARAKNGKLLQMGIPAVLNSLVWFIFIATQDFRFQYPVYVMALIAPALLFVPREKIQTTTAQAGGRV